MASPPVLVTASTTAGARRHGQVGQEDLFLSVERISPSTASRGALGTKSRSAGSGPLGGVSRAFLSAGRKVLRQPLSTQGLQAAS